MQTAQQRPANSEAAQRLAASGEQTTVEEHQATPLEALATGSARMQAHGALAGQLKASPVLAAQRKQVDSINGSARLAAQQQRQNALQRVEDEPPMQAKLSVDASAQRKEEGGAKPNNTGLPDQLKSGIENLSGMPMDNVKVHYNSAEPAQLNALAYAQGTDIHVAPGQEQHLPHEAWHVVQQAQGRVKPTRQMKQGVPVNDDAGLENEADVMGAKALSVGQANSAQLKQTASSATTVQREGEPPVAEAAATEAVAESEATEQAPSAEQEAPSEAVSEELADNTDEAGAVVTDAGYEVKADLPAEQKLALVKKGDDTVKGVTAAASVSSGVVKLAEGIEKSKEPATQGAKLFESTNSAFAHIVDGVSGVVMALVKPLIDAGLAISGMTTKWAQWTTFEQAVVEQKNGKPVRKADAPPEAVYALSKSPSGFMRFIKDFFMHLVTFTSNLLMLIPGAQIVGAPMKLFGMVVGLLDTVYKAGKSIYQKLFGEKKDSNSVSLLDKALRGDQPALQLIFKLRLPSVAGTGYSALDKVKGKLNEASLVNLANLAGVDVPKAERIIDKMTAGGGGPANTEELLRMLRIVCANASSKDLLRNEIKETMTGFGK